MFLLRKPDARRLHQIHDACRHLPLTYREVGQSRGIPPPGYVGDHHRIALGRGAPVFTQAVQALRSWQMLRLGWLEPAWPEARVETGALVGTLARVGGLWVVNVCRIVDVVTAADALQTFSFAYGTLPGHVERGEERFTVEWHAADDAVWYDLRAFSAPGRLLTRLAYPLARRCQRRFARDSLRAMVRAVQDLPGANRPSSLLLTP